MMKYIILFYFVCCVYCEDFYELLGVSRNSDNREIRKAFKKLALSMHPDKNKDDPEANAKFLRLNRAYEVLRDEDLRKKYDLHGEDGITENQQSPFHSWNYYYESFGIYDDDPEIITLGKTDFEQSVLDSRDVWFVNFYSPGCSHCHHLAPEWRKLAVQLEGVIRVGAVNCEDDWYLCRMQGIRAYPTLRLYPGARAYTNVKTVDHMVEFVLSQMDVDVVDIVESNLDYLVNRHSLYRDRPWLIIFCSDQDHHFCIDEKIRIKIAAILEGSVNVGLIECSHERSLCDSLGYKNAFVYYKIGKVSKDSGQEIEEENPREICEKVLSFLPLPEIIDSDRMQDIIWRLEADKDKPWLVHFGTDNIEDKMNHLEMAKLPATLSNINVGQVSCEQQRTFCQKYHINKYPTFILFKTGAIFEYYIGRTTIHDVANFARTSSSAVNIQALTPQDFPDVVESGNGWFIDFFAPWCPPCLRLLPVFRQASSRLSGKIRFGTVDCTVHSSLCSSYGIRSYPTTILYNQTRPHTYHGEHAIEEIIEFAYDTLNPKVRSLSLDAWKVHLEHKPTGEMWVVDFYVPWCGPCQKLSPHWRKVGKVMSDVDNVHIADVDCTVEAELCRKQGVRAYPTIRIYHLGAMSDKSYSEYNGWEGWNEWALRSWIFQYIPSSVITLGNHNFKPQVLDGNGLWLVDFYAPWCSHCKVYEPEFQLIAKALAGKAKCGKVDCQKYGNLCKQAGVNAYPTVKLYTGDSSKVGDGLEVERDKQPLIQRVQQYILHDEL